jgi:hypothetical protein
MRTPQKNYQTDDAIYQWHKEKTKSNASWAFKDADYATGLWRCETEWDRCKEYGIWVIIWGLLLVALYGLSYMDRVFK